MIKYRFCLCLVSILLSCLCLPAFAQEFITLPEMVVSARGYEVETSRTPGGVEVLEAEDLSELNPVSIPDALDRLPGVDISSDSSWGSEVVIRGLSRDSVVLLIDGCRVNTATDINGRFGLLNPEDIERVEVLKGPVSTLYGSGSIGGVVNIVTKKGEFSEDAGLHGEMASFAQSNPSGGGLYGNLSYSLPKTWFFASGGWRDLDSYYDGDGGKVHNSQFQDTAGKLAAGMKWSDYSQSEFQYQYIDGSEIGVPGTGSAPLPTIADVTLERNNRRMLQFKQLFQPASGLLQKSELMFFYQLIARQPRINNFTAGAVNSIEPKADHESYGGRWTNILDIESHRLAVGADVWSWRMSGSRTRNLASGAVIIDDPTPNSIQSSYGMFMEDDWELSEDWSLNLGARLDYVTIDYSGKTLSGLPDIEPGIRDDLSYGAHAGLSWAAGENWTLTGLLATSYRTPNSMELFKDINLSSGMREVGNPDIDPERSMFAELGVHYSDTGLIADTSIFVNHIDDYISSELIEEGIYRMSNISKAEIWGVEQSIDWNFYDNWTAYGSLAYSQGRDVTKGDWLRFVAPLNGLAGLRQRLDFGLWWEADIRYALEQDKVPDDVDSTDGWITLNARAGYEFDLMGLENELTLSVNNILDGKHHNYLATSRGVELYEPGINAILAWRIKF